MMDYLDLKKLQLTIDENQIINCIYDNKTFNHCKIVRCFPLKNPYEYLSINYLNDGEYEEIGIIKDLNDLDDNNKSIIFNDLNYHYFMPEILSITSRKYTRSFYTFNCLTSSGNTLINVNDLVNNIFIYDKDLYIKDVNEMYYIIKNYQEKKDKHIKFIKGFL